MIIFSHQVYPGILGVNFDWDFLSEPWPLKPPCLVELGRVVGGTEVSCLDSCFVSFIYSLVPFRAGFFFLKGIFPVCMFYRIWNSLNSEKPGGEKKKNNIIFLIINNIIPIFLILYYFYYYFIL